MSSLHMILIFLIWMVLWWCITNKVPDKYKTPWPHPDKLPSSFDKLMHGMFWFGDPPLGKGPTSYREWEGWPSLRKRMLLVFANVGLGLVILVAYFYLIG